MKPGRELDALVAAKVMGLSDIRIEPTPAMEIAAGLTDIDHWVYGEHPVRKCGIPLPHYSTDIAAAWGVLNKMISNGWALSLNNKKDFHGGCHVIFETLVNHATADAETMEEAICLTALRAVGVEV